METIRIGSAKANYLKILVAVLFVTLPFLGFYLGTKYEKAVAPDFTEVQPPVIQTAPKPITDQTDNWKTYRNEEYGFEFKYPPSWSYPQISNEKDYTEILFNETIIYIEAGSNFPGLPQATVEKYIKSLSPADEGITVSNPTNYSLSGHLGKKITFNGYENSLPTYLVFPLNSKDQSGILVINSDYNYGVPDLTPQDAVREIDQILSTFKFIDSGQDRDVESYISCGCGCCGFTEPLEEIAKTECLYKSKGESIQDKISQDEASTPEACATSGCSYPIKYIYCD